MIPTVVLSCVNYFLTTWAFRNVHSLFRTYAGLRVSAYRPALHLYTSILDDIFEVLKQYGLCTNPE